MPIYRAYTQPDNPVVYRVLGLEAADDDVQYSGELKTACILAAGPQPKAPTICPRCYQPATFESRLCYKYGIAGAWNMFCHKCRKVHIPTQKGPTEKDLEGIEAIRDRDRQAHRARKDAQARARAAKKAKAKKKTSQRAATNGSIADEDERTDVRPPREVVSEHRPFGIIGNAMRVDIVDQTNRKKTDNDMQHAEDARASVQTVSGAICAPHKNLPIVRVESLEPEVRTILLVLWEKPGQPPFVDRIDIPSQNELFLFHHPHIRAIPPPTQFERYVFEGAIWSPVPWDVSPIEVTPDDKIIFVRVMDITCRGFGQQLHNYQVDRGDALPSHQRLAHVIYEPPKGHRWILVWYQDRVPPAVFLCDFTLKDDAKNNKRVPRPWLKLLRDAPFYLIWHEVQTRWRGVIGKQSLQLVDAPMYLFADPRMETRLGSGEAIAWLDSWRAEHPLDERGPSASDGSSARAPLSSSTNRNAPTRYGKKRGAPAPIEARALSISDDEPSADCKCAKPPKRARTCVRNESAVINITDDESEFIQGSSSSPMKGKARARDLDAHSQCPEREVIDLTG